ncbi:MAG: hypothetical protein IKL25_01610 [Clostridia bacterium]|nr:hypothetical protein [Clostridia bacterium]
MRRLFTLLLVLMMTAGIALASEPANPADPTMIAELLPGHTYVEGIDDGDVLRLLLKRGDGALVFVGGVRGADGTWLFTESTPLPEGTILGVENFTHSLGIPSPKYYDCVSIEPYADGTWGVSMVMPDDGGMIFLKKHLIYDGLYEYEGYLGDHPWSDISVIDWTTLPKTESEALSHLERTGWAVVNNPDPADRLHLRASPDPDAVSFGKYYNRTPVRIREYGEDWCAVTVCGQDGWMMTKYLTFGEAMDTVDYAGPWLTWKEDLGTYRVYAEPRTSGAFTESTGEYGPVFCVMGVAEDFYHVWLTDTEEYGYIRMDDLWEGNG